MALIGRIRNNLWIVLILVGLAMLGFIIMDMGSGGGGGGAAGNTTMGKIAGKKVDYIDFDKKIRLRYNGASADQYTLKNALWNSLINEAIVEKEAKALGLEVSDNELETLVYGPNYSPIIIQDFPLRGAYGQPDIEQLNEIRDLEAGGFATNPAYAPLWNEEKERVRRDRMQTKLTNLVSKSVYTPTWMAKMQSNDRNGTAQIAYVAIPFDRVANTEVVVEDADYKAYLNENKAKYTRDLPQQTISYVTFDIKPTAEDSLALKNELGSLVEEFNRPKSDDQIFVESNQGIYSDAYVFKDQLGAIADDIFDEEVGTVYGPYLDGDNYKAAKLLDRRVIPDSVAARHILRNAEPQNPLALQAARDTIAFIQAELAKGVSFEDLAKEYSQDPGSGAKGGDLGTFKAGAMVPAFNNACFYESSDEMKVVETQFGVHLIDVTRQYNNGKKGVKVAYLQKPIVPSKATTKGVYADALRFASANTDLEAMKKAATEADLEVATSAPLDENAFNIANLGTGESTRTMIKWANEANIGTVSPSVYRYTDKVRFYENKYVVAAVASKDKAGLPSVESMKSTLKNLVTNKKKGEVIASQIAGLDLAAVVAKYDGVKIDSTNTAFSGAIPDPELVAGVFKMNAGETCQPIIGANGVYIATMISKPTPSEATNIPSLKSQISSTAKGQARSLLLPALKKNTKIDDKRSDFF
ncbi:MAG: peptidyl-prolyl cis-trans isomerase D [Maribacter sp.]|jgi:peptidyl-prolyl cis-trans isomerase D